LGFAAPKSGISVSDYAQGVAPYCAGFPSQADTELQAPNPESAEGTADLLGNRLWAQPVIDPGFDLIDDARRNQLPLPHPTLPTYTPYGQASAMQRLICPCRPDVADFARLNPALVVIKH
jgi:hypothetical protein